MLFSLVRYATMFAISSGSALSLNGTLRLRRGPLHHREHLAFFHALSLGPVSIVAPVFGLFLVTSSLFGVFLLDEVLALHRGFGITLAMLAIALLLLE
ncbi:hypothetical protein [Halorarius halobius]|uniref:hypothetical protein n=1 Tax=Halorarius halobius TaxID=2962671 RepID=UPI0020CE53DC|nr:hypothetical protein [Halorarius halobius]